MRWCVERKSPRTWAHETKRKGVQRPSLKSLSADDSQSQVLSQITPLPRGRPVGEDVLRGVAIYGEIIQ